MFKNGLKRVGKILSLCTIMYTAYVGPGFASGTQTVTYFNKYGWLGVFVGPLVCGLLCFLFNILLFEINRIYKPNTYREAYNTIYRKKGLQLFFGIFKEIQVVAVVIIALAAQISTTAVLLNQIFGLPKVVGMIGFCVLVLVLALWGAGVLRKVGTILGIVILAICAYVAIICFGNATPLANNYLATKATYTDYGYNGFQAWFSFFMIVVFFMNGYEACVPASKGIIERRRDVILESAVTAILCAGSTMIFTFIFAAGMPNIIKEEIPTLWAINNLSNQGMTAKIIYVIFAIAAMVSSSVAFIFTVCGRFEPLIEKKWKNSKPIIRKLIIALFFIVICSVLSLVGVLNIINYGYKIFTMIVGPVMLIPLIVSVPYRLYKDRKDGILNNKFELVVKDTINNENSEVSVEGTK